MLRARVFRSGPSLRRCRCPGRLRPALRRASRFARSAATARSSPGRPASAGPGSPRSRPMTRPRSTCSRPTPPTQRSTCWASPTPGSPPAAAGPARDIRAADQRGGAGRRGRGGHGAGGGEAATEPGTRRPARCERARAARGHGRREPRHGDLHTRRAKAPGRQRGRAEPGLPRSTRRARSASSTSAHGPAAATVRTAGFSGFAADALRRQRRPDLRPNATAAQDLEPEYIAVSPDPDRVGDAPGEQRARGGRRRAGAGRRRSWVSAPSDHARLGSGLDASDQDGRIRIRPWPVRGLYQPDAVAAYRTAGATYLVTANEGAPRQTTGSTRWSASMTSILDPQRFPHAAWLQQDAPRPPPGLEGRRRPGRRRRRRPAPRLRRPLVLDPARRRCARLRQRRRAGADHGQGCRLRAGTQTCSTHRTTRTASTSAATPAGPSRPASTLGRIGHRTYAFIALRRPSGIATYDMTDPAGRASSTHANTRDFTQDPKAVGDKTPTCS